MLYSLYIPKDPAFTPKAHPLFEHFQGKEVFGSEAQLRTVKKAMRRRYNLEIEIVRPGKLLSADDIFISSSNHTMAVHRERAPRTIYVGIWNFNRQLFDTSKTITW